jgi:hypothetical protein
LAEFLKLILHAVLPKGEQSAGHEYRHNNIFDSHNNTVGLAVKRRYVILVMTAWLNNTLQTLYTTASQILLIKIYTASYVNKKCGH